MYYDRYRAFFPRITPAVKYLIIINVGISVFELLFGLKWITVFGLTPADFWRGHIWQVITYMFLHGGIFHLLFNMFVLWMFGSTLESIWGLRRFLTFYFICGTGAGLLNAVVTPGSQIPMVGSSGAIYGLLMAFGILFPNQLIYVWGIFPVKVKHFVIIIGVIEFLLAMSATQSGIAHFAHLGGMFFGLVYMKWEELRGLVSGWQNEKRRIRQLKVIWNREKEKEKLQKEVDELLDKIRRSGINSLTNGERERIRKASSKIEEMENKEQ